MSALLKFGSMALISVLAFAGVYFLKVTLNKLIPAGSSAEALLRAMPQIVFEGKFWLAVLCYGVAMVVYLFLLQSGEVSKIFSVTVGVNVLLTALGAVLFLGDTIDAPRAIGILLIATGIFIING